MHCLQIGGVYKIERGLNQLKKIIIHNRTSDRHRLWLFKEGESLARQVIVLEPREQRVFRLTQFQTSDRLEVRDRNALKKLTLEDQQRLRERFTIIEEK